MFVSINKVERFSPGQLLYKYHTICGNIQLDIFDPQFTHSLITYIKMLLIFTNMKNVTINVILGIFRVPLKNKSGNIIVE